MEEENFTIEDVEVVGNKYADLEYTQDVAEDEAAYEDWLMNNLHLRGTPEFEQIKDGYNELSGYNITPQGIAKKVMKFGAGELNTIYDAAGKVVSNPVQSTKNLFGAIGDVGLTAATNFLPEGMVDSMYDGMDNPNSLGYKFNEGLKQNRYVGDNLSFLAAKPRENYEEMGKQMGEHYGDVYDKLTGGVESATKLISENPLESLLNFGGATSLVKAPIKATGLLDNKVGKIIDNALSQSPTSAISGVPQYFKSKANKAGAVEAGKQLTADAVIKAGVAAGYDLPPSAYKGTGIMNKIGRIVEGAPFISGNTAGKVVVKNQKTTDKLMRKFLNITDDISFEDVLMIVQGRSGPVYNRIKSLKAVKKTTSGKQWVDAGPLMGKKLIPTKKTKTVHRSGEKIFNDLEASRTKQNKFFEKGKYDEGVKQGEKTAELNKEMLSLAKYHKKPNLVEELNAARTDYAKAYSVFPYVSDGSVNASAFAKANRYNTKLTGEGKIIRDFANVPNNKKYLNLPLPQDSKTFTTLEKYAMGAAVVADASTGGLVGTVASIVPSLLTSRKLGRQNKFMNPNYGANGLLELFGNPNIVRNSALVPSLLDSSEIKDLPYLGSNE